MLTPTTETDPIELTTVSETKMLAETSMVYEVMCMEKPKTWHIQVCRTLSELHCEPREPRSDALVAGCLYVLWMPCEGESLRCAPHRFTWL